jgi:hypothetical protein
MSRGWSKRSKEVYGTLDPRLQILVTRIRDEVVDISLVCGHRTKDEQNAAFDAGYSQLRWPAGKHNKLPSIAVDLQPYPYPTATNKLWASLAYIAGRAHDIAHDEGFKVRWGGDWDGDGDLTDQNFDDLFHIEVIE